MLTFQKNQSLKDYSTWGIGGPAKLFTVVSTPDEMQEALSQKMRTLIIGKGSNCLFDDRGFDGLVILNKISFFERNSDEFYVGGGYSFALLGVKTARCGYSGLEFAAGIPGSVGGAVYMNAGAGKNETFDCLVEVDYVTSKKRATFKKEELEFSYRFSSFHKMNGAIVGARFKLIQSDAAKKYQHELVAYRTATQPYGEKSCGCVFRNPKGKSAGALIELSGLKGYRLGDLEVSDRHANFVVNKGQGTAKQALELIEKVKNIVREKTGEQLEIEVRKIEF